MKRFIIGIFALAQVFCLGPASAQNSNSGVLIKEATNVAVIASPQGDRLGLALYNMLYTLPIEGGRAQQITDLVFDGFHPAWSPKGDEIAVQSYYDGRFHIWLVSADGKSRKQLTRGPFTDSYPAWSPDGAQIVFSSDRYTGVNNLWLLTLATGELKQLTSGPGAKTEAVWSRDGREIAYLLGGGGGFGPASAEVRALNPNTGESRVLVPRVQGNLAGLSWSPDSKTLGYIKGGKLTLWDIAAESERQLSDYDDVFPFPAQWLSGNRLVYGANGKIVQTDLAAQVSSEIPFELLLPLNGKAYKKKTYDLTSTRAKQIKGIAGPALSPDGKQVVFKALNDLWLLDIGNNKPTQLTQDSFYEVDPVWSRDGKSIAYSSDKGGSPDIYLLNLETKQEQRLTSLPGSEFSPALSADGKLAFHDQDYGVHVQGLADRSATKLTSGGMFATAGRLSWSPAGNKLAYAASAAGSNQIAILDVETKQVTMVEPAPGNTLTTRGDEGPVWSPDGQWLAFTMEATLWVLPVSPEGEAIGAARQLTTEAADAPSWNGDSSQLLYLNNGRLKLVSIDGGEPVAVPLDLSWRQDVPQTSYLIHAGGLWDGKNPTIRKDVDILIEGARIVSIKPHDEKAKARRGVTFVDASDLVVAPGLMDGHYHQQVKSKILGDRQGRLFLAFGITTTRSPGDQTYRALEDRESLAAGLRVGPRYFMSGDILDGYTATWDFSRAVVTEAQLQLELERAKALDYDLMKTYANFRHNWQQQVIDWAHKEMGVPVASHYLYPSAGMGADGVEHIQSGPIRHGINFSSRGNMYQDVIDIFAKSGIVGSTTIFAAAYQYAEHPELLEDARIKALYMPADQQALVGRVGCASGTSPCGPLFTPSKAGAENLTRIVRRIMDAGGHIMAGTDAPLDEPAISLHNNLRGLAAFGLSPFEVLQLTTSKVAQALNVDKDLGTLEAGKLADMIFVRGDPSQDVADLANVESVMKGGRLYSLDELIGPFASQ